MRKYSRGYTGQKSCTLRYQYPGIDEIKEALSKVKKLLDTEFECMKALEYNQFIRGKFYLIVDSLMTWNENNYIFKKPEVQIIQQAAEMVIKLICKWVTLFPKYSSYYAELIQTPNLYLISTKHAVAASLPELIEMFKLTCGFLTRCDSKFELINAELNEKMALTRNNFITENFFQKANINNFYKEKGMELIIRIVADPNNQCPIPILTDLLDILIEASSIQKNDSIKQPSSNIMKELTNRFSHLSDRDIREINEISIQNLLTILSSLVKSKASREISKDIIPKLFFSISIQLINSQYIQKKLLGVTLLKQIIPTNFSDLSEIRWNNPEELIKIIEEKKLLNIIYGENANVVILKKLEYIFLFYISRKTLNKQYIKLL